ncbi:MAG: transcription termination/antitermination protein NusG [Lentisphaeraceae bacterium]|nr:transcription termination/antitermination protein NusG [Lentisphaeraceae bacterium]
MKGKWYTVQTLSGKEMKAKESIEKRSTLEGMDDYVFEILVPQERVTEIKRGKKTTTNRKFFPGYMFVNIDLEDEYNKIREDVWYFIKDTNGIINFIGGDAPVALTLNEIEDIRNALRGDEKAVKPKVDFTTGEVVKIKDGAFENFEGAILNVDPDKGKLQIEVTIFGRSTPVEVEYWQVERTN